MMKIQTFSLVQCSACRLSFAPVDWLPWRVRGYCCEECDPALKEEPKDAQTDLFACVLSEPEAR